jgi:hypothetical protein
MRFARRILAATLVLVLVLVVVLGPCTKLEDEDRSLRSLRTRTRTIGDQL